MTTVLPELLLIAGMLALPLILTIAVMAAMIALLLMFALCLDLERI